MIRLAMAGASGRMGRTILGLAARDKKFKIVGGLERKGCSDLGSTVGDLIGVPSVKAPVTDKTADILAKTDVLIDFTHASAVRATLKHVVKAKVGYIIGTTGLSKPALKEIKLASKKIPIVQSPNMSIGVNLLFGLTDIASRVLDESYDAEISETHHRGKKDSPSGTAMKLLEVLAEGRGKNAEKNTLYGRKGDIGVRPKGKFGVLAMRGGDVVGDHTVFFYGDGERVELTHRASSREAFAKGSLVAAKFLKKQKKGLFDMRQVLGMA